MLLHYSDDGTGDPVVLIHGMAGSGRYWDELKPLIKNKRVITVDLLGFGRSPMPTSVNYNYETHIESIIETLDFLNVTRPMTLVGHSMGALLALRLAITYEKRVEKLILIGMPIYKDPKTARETITNSKKLNKMIYYGLSSHILCSSWCKFLRPFSKRVAPLYLRKIPKNVAQDSVYHTWQSYSQSMKNVIENQHVSRDLSKLIIPTILIYGNQDLPAELASLHIAENIKVRTLNGTHQIVYESPDEVVKNI